MTVSRGGTAQKGDALLLIKIDRRDGRVVWTRRAGTGTALRVAAKGKNGNGRSAQKFHLLHNLASPSPVTDEGRVYFLNLKGLCTVVAAAPRFKGLASNQLPADTIASPAVSNGRLFLRGRRMLYCIGAR